MGPCVKDKKMDIETAKILVEYSDGELELYENYSGRGMYGSKTTGVTGSDIYGTISEIMCSATPEERVLVAEFLTNMSKDNMGLDMIYY
jgi:hypothetical protein